MSGINRKHRLIALAVLLVLLFFECIYFRNEIGQFYGYSRAALSYYGSTGQEVRNIQTRLKNWGYYKGSVDGIYGYNTYKAVRLFQYKNGLTVDGIAGAETLSALGLPAGKTAKVSGTSNASGSDVDLLAHLVHGEARGEPYVGQVAIAAVILNRTRDSRFPKTIAGVIYQPGAFTAISDGQANLQPDNTAYKAAKDALNGWDPTYGCIYYWNPATATSKWIWSRPIVIRIGKHVFAK